MNVLYSHEFQKYFVKLPAKIQEKYREQEMRFKKNWRDKQLHIKKLSGHQFAFSFRITRRYRVFFYFHDPETAIFFAIDHRKDAYRDL